MKDRETSSALASEGFNYWKPYVLIWVVLSLLLWIGGMVSEKHRQASLYRQNMQQAAAAMQNQEFPQAVQYFTNAQWVNPKSEEATAGLEKALNLKKQANLKAADRHAAYADVLMGKGKFRLAVNEYTVALRLNPALKPALTPKLEKAYFHQGFTLMNEEQWEEAIRWHRNAFFSSTPARQKVAISQNVLAREELAREQEIARRERERQEEIARQEQKREEEIAQREQERERLRETANSMKKFEGWPIGIAVSGIRLTTRLSQSYGGYTYVRGNSRFVCICVAAYNDSDETTHVNPNDFTLSNSEGYTMSHDTETYSLGNHFDAVDLPPKGQTSGWLIFILPNDNEYTLHYNGLEGEADKQIVVR